MKNILVTGGHGLVGSALREIMPDAIYVSSEEFDLRFRVDVKEMLLAYKPTHVVHLAALVGGIKDNIARPANYLEDNVLMNTHLVQQSYHHGVERFIGMLTSCSYPDKVDSYPMSETQLFDGAPSNSNFAYAMSKRTMATQIDAYNHQFGTKYNYLIPCNLYGEMAEYDDNRSHFIAALIKRIYAAKVNGEEKIVLMGNGLALRQHLYVHDLAKIIKMTIDSDITDSFNIAPSENMSIREIAEMAVNGLGLDIEFNTSAPSGQYRKDIDTKRFKSYMPTFMFTPFDRGFKNCYEYYEESQLSK